MRMATLIRPATPPEVKRSPMAARDPTLGRDEPDVGPVSRREWAGFIVWGTLAVVVTTFELLAWRGTNIPFPTLSETAGNLQARHNWTAMPILAGLVVLGARIVFYPWPFREAES
jgi:hypothetical protein